MKEDRGARRRQAARPAFSRSPRRRGREALPSLTGPEQHGPVETRGLGGVPCPLAQPLRHAPLRQTVEPALRTGSAPECSTSGPSASAAVTCQPGPKPCCRSSYHRRPERPARRRRGGRDRGQGQGQVSYPQDRGHGSVFGERTPGPGVPGPRENPMS